ncbi:hypothetical protein [Paracidovorax anthurii]|uniref:Uncharacterized protein n=1 Tax=Paracidovorax anthurii TaxID=78229 RepID=A0A328ZV04_9BURK|nr:hypothetical protein [Paracidovorax anthurii]RAR86096.1 hypothetical protein AX018_100257 [Paracidovorax anthurii]
MSNPCLILEVSDHDQWEPFRGCQRLPPDRRPTVLHPSREVAEEEALRLARTHPGRMFAVMEVVTAARTVAVPTHVTLGGLVFADRQLPRLMQVGDGADEIPF